MALANLLYTKVWPLFVLWRALCQPNLIISEEVSWNISSKNSNIIPYGSHTDQIWSYKLQSFFYEYGAWKWEIPDFLDTRFFLNNMKKYEKFDSLTTFKPFGY